MPARRVQKHGYSYWKRRATSLRNQADRADIRAQKAAKRMLMERQRRGKPKRGSLEAVVARQVAKPRRYKIARYI